MAIEDVTRADLEQMFENQTTLFSKEFEKVYKELDRVHDEIAELRTTVDRIDRRDDEDISTLFKEVELIKRHVGMTARA